jgi:hypothetical protein
VSGRACPGQSPLSFGAPPGLLHDRVAVHLLVAQGNHGLSWALRTACTDTTLYNAFGCFIMTYRQDPKKEEIVAPISSTLEEMERRFEEIHRPFINTVSKGGEFTRRRAT